MPGGGGGKTQTSQTVQDNTPWGPLADQLKRGFKRSEDISNTPQQFFPGQTYAGFGGQSEQALNAMFQRGQAGSPLNRGAQDLAQQTIAGDYLDNPHLQGAIDASTRPIFDQLQNQTLPGITSQFARAGRSGPEGNALNANRMDAVDRAGQSASDQAARLAMGAYGQERGMQQQAMMGAPGLAASDYGDISQMMGAGQQRDFMSQQGINDQMARWNFDQTQPYNQLAQHMGQLQGYGNFGTQTGTTTGPGGTNSSPLMGAFGGAAMGAPLGPWGMAGGAGLGFLSTM